MRKKNIWNKRIPTVFGLILLIIGLITTTVILRKNTVFFGRAAAGTEPHNIRITNIADTSFTITYTTTEKTIGSVQYGKTEEEKNSALDDRDQTAQTPQEYTTHHITVKDLEPNTKYVFAILSGGETYRQNDQPFTATTGTVLDEEPTDREPVTGSVVLQDGDAAPGILVYGSANDAQVISTLTNPDGSFSLPIIAMRTKDLTSYLTIEDDTALTALFRSDIAESEVKFLSSQTNPLPQITLSKNYDFLGGEEPLITDNPQATESANTEKFPLESASPAGQKEQTKQEPPFIESPKINEEFTDQRPEFSGTALPNEEIQIIIKSDPIQATIKADSKGDWTYRPTSPLSPGKHTITIITKDALGLTKRVTQSFTVFAQGSKFTEPSVSPGQTTPSATPTRPPSPTVTKIPTTAPSATPTTTIAPTAILSPTTMLATPTTIHVSPTGNGLKPGVSRVPSVRPTGNDSLIVSGLIGVGVTVIGLILFFVTVGGGAL